MMLKTCLKKIWILIIPLILFLSSCEFVGGYVKITTPGPLEVEVGDTYQLTYGLSTDLAGAGLKWTSSNETCVEVGSYGLIYAAEIGEATIRLQVGDYYSIIKVIVVEKKVLTLDASKYEIEVGETIELSCNLSDAVISIVSGSKYAILDGNMLMGLAKGTVTLVAKNSTLESEYLTIEIVAAKEADKCIMELRATKYYLTVGESTTLDLVIDTNLTNYTISYEIRQDDEYIKIENDQILAVKSGGSAKVVAKIGDFVSNEIEIYTIENTIDPESIVLTADKTLCDVGDYVILNYEIYPSNASNAIEFYITSGEDSAYIIANKVYITDLEKVTIIAKIGNVYSNEITINNDSLDSDPYADMTSKEFYANYTIATSYLDAYYRSLHGFMSGSIDDQDQEPTLASYQPQENGLYVRNSYGSYSSDGNIYYVYDSYGDIVNTIYKGGGYVTLEEVAAYLLAFSDIPANYTSKKSAKPSSSIWGIYLRLNNSAFSGDTSKYPYEPELPNISGCGGSLQYYEVDVGTTGTDCDASYDITVYNDGTTITRGAARLVYTRYDADGNGIIDINERYVFYTYNHYNDFQEYLNYEGGWGEKFGNITGGGQLSSKVYYNPTSYVPVIYKDFSTFTNSQSINVNLIIDDIYKKDWYML